MKKILLVSAVALSTLFVGCGASGSKVGTTESDSLSYAVGVEFGAQLKQIGSDVNVDKLSAAIKAFLADKNVLTPEDAQNFIREYFMVRLPQKNLDKSQKFIEETAKKEGIQSTESGLLYKVETEGAEKPMSDQDTVVVNYKGTLPNGTQFDSSYDRGEPATFPLDRVIPGWTEGIKLVGKGGKITLYIPAALGYGERGAGNSIGPNEALIFEVELLDIKPFVATATEEPAK